MKLDKKVISSIVIGLFIGWILISIFSNIVRSYTICSYSYGSYNQTYVRCFNGTTYIRWLKEDSESDIIKLIK